MANKEATARIKINKLLEAAGWRFFAEGKLPANIQLEPGVTIKTQDLDALGENLEKLSKGFIDYLLLNEKNFPFITLEAKSEDKHPLVGKEQARRYARSQNCRFIILSNGNLHYFWDLERGNPYLITTFPTPTSVMGYQKTVPDIKRLVEEGVGDDYIVLTQRPGYAAEAAWRNEAERDGFIAANSLRFLRLYQKKAIVALQSAIQDGNDRFLFEMATGTGKTLTAAAVIKLFLRTGNARRVLFLVDRLELEDQAKKTFSKVLSNDYKTVIYKENRDDWRHAEIVVTTVQSLLFNNKYQQLFSPTDFDLVISDEAHRSIGGNARAVFDYFIGYNREVFDKPTEFYTLDKLRKAAAVDRRLGLREILEKIFGLIPHFKSRDELLEEEFAKFVADYKPEKAEAILALKNYFKAYVTSDQIRHIIDSGELTDLATNSFFPLRDFRAVPKQYRTLIPNYIKDYVSLNQFAP